MKSLYNHDQYFPIFILTSILLVCVGLLSLLMVLQRINEPTSYRSTATVGSGSQLRMMYPLYNYPQWYTPANYIWDDIASSGSSVGLMSIVNPANGPGTTADPNSDYRRGLQDLKSGSQIIGYVHTSYGNRSEALIKADIDLWKSNYGLWVTGIFFDEVSTDCSRVSWYGSLVTYARSQGLSMTVLNPGTTTNECYVQANLGQIVMFENTQAQWQSYLPPSWMSQYPADQFVTLVHGATSANLGSNIQLAQERNFGWVFITNDTMPNPWDALPSYWNQEIAGIISANSAPLLPPTQTPLPSVTSPPTTTQTPIPTPTGASQPTAIPTVQPTTTPSPTPIQQQNLVACGVSNICQRDADCQTGMVCRLNQWHEPMCVLPSQIAQCQTSSTWQNCCVQSNISTSTRTPTPTSTQTPTITLAFSITPTPTRNPTPTITPTRKPTPTITLTRTPTSPPPTPTATLRPATPPAQYPPTIPGDRGTSCVVSGCYNEICSDQVTNVTCNEYQPRFRCLQQYATCQKIDGRCRWLYLQGYGRCLDSVYQAVSTPTPQPAPASSPVASPQDIESFIRLLSNRNFLELFLEFLRELNNR